MKKLRLNVDALRVESFRTDPVPAAGGTVRANEYETVSCPSQGFSCFCFPTDLCGTEACSDNASCAGTCTHEN